MYDLFPIAERIRLCKLAAEGNVLSEEHAKAMSNEEVFKYWKTMIGQD